MNRKLILIFLACSVLSLSQAQERDTSCKDVKIIVDAHTKYRKQIAQGLLEKQPKSSNMNRMVWDDKLEKSAEKRAIQIMDRISTQEKEGESILTEIRVLSSKPNWRKVIELWFNEHENYKFERFNPEHTGTRHYTQIVWAESYKVGCAYLRRRMRTVYVCKYESAGNIRGSYPYKRRNGCNQLCCSDREQCRLPLYGNCNRSD